MKPVQVQWDVEQGIDEGDNRVTVTTGRWEGEEEDQGKQGQEKFYFGSPAPGTEDRGETNRGANKHRWTQ